MSAKRSPMARYKDRTNQRYGLLVCLEYVGRTEKGRSALWKCKCDCGNTTVVRSISLVTGGTKSCGCLQRKAAAKECKKRTQHGAVGTSLYYRWAHIKERCLNPSCQSYPHYGGRGIMVCDEWLEDFTAFRDWALANGYREDLTIERIDVNGNYEPSNCTWIPMSEQHKNKRNSKKPVMVA